MATANPKLSVYVSKEIQKHVKKFVKDKKLRSTSAAVVYILEEHFGVAETISSAQSNAEVDALKITVANLDKRVTQLEAQKSKIPKKPIAKVEDEKHLQLEVPQSSAKEAHKYSVTETEQLTELRRSRLDYLHRNDQLPFEANGYLIVKKRKQGRKTLWELQEAKPSNSDS